MFVLFFLLTALFSSTARAQALTIVPGDDGFRVRDGLHDLDALELAKLRNDLSTVSEIRAELIPLRRTHMKRSFQSFGVGAAGTVVLLGGGVTAVVGMYGGSIDNPMFWTGAGLFAVGSAVAVGGTVHGVRHARAYRTAKDAVVAPSRWYEEDEIRSWGAPRRGLRAVRLSVQPSGVALDGRF